MDVSHIPPQEAAALVDQQGYTYIDVRSIPEFIDGHPAPAVNIPIMHRDPGTGMMTPNPDFLNVVKAHFPTDAKLVMGCRSGARSARATELLLHAGYSTVVNMQCGYDGERNQFGQVVNPGWAELGLPTSDENGDGVSYESLSTQKT